MPIIVIYTAQRCGYCTMAKRLLDSKGLHYTEIDVDSTPELRDALIQKTQRRTVPQIFIGEHHVGGFDDLVVLDRQQGFAALLHD